ncbi:hypothetical protein DPMN_103465 [Dreissena polymorpha]|uniref:Secreted protein n=1 Tax=Dreissena polymorpha TaxID=45954 RepID=A0A9D4K0U2_DREPO|nr:hypothetical protein DPMN_103465 [Dreissena polymorpha]
MMSGKAVSRAVRGHLLVDAALCAMVTAEIYGTTPQQTPTCERTDTDQADSIQTANPQNEPPPTFRLKQTSIVFNRTSLT